MSTRIHVLHIGKTGGTALNGALRAHADALEYELVFGGHTETLADVPVGEQAVFVLRDPASRFVSGFVGRLREDRPRYSYPWTSEERWAFQRFRTPDELARGLGSRWWWRRRRAHRAMRGIGHVNTPYSFWLGDENALRARADDLFFVAFQEQLDSDFERLKQKLGLPASAVLPKDETQAHKTPASLRQELSEAGRRQLERWYREDYLLLAACRELAPSVNR